MGRCFPSVGAKEEVDGLVAQGGVRVGEVGVYDLAGRCGAVCWGWEEKGGR